MDNSIKYLNLNELIPGEFQPHIEDYNDNLENLTNSIKSYGILVPLVVRKKGIKYEIILGNRRYNAARVLGIEKVPVIILDIDDAKVIDLIIADNIQRKELTGKEEGYLYEKALEYPNTNKEKLSINLGIPLDRITSKLNLLKKNNNKNIPKLSNNQNIISSHSHSNFINNDIINLTELNKKERDEFNMNNNQFANNDQTNINNQGVQTQSTSPQEPTFGGRFFPSLEDEPTNMNLNAGMNNINPINNPTLSPTPNYQTASPLIDLTETTPQEQSTSNIALNDINLNQQQSLAGEVPAGINNQIPNNEELSPITEDSQNSISIPNFNNNTIDQSQQNIASPINSSVDNIGLESSLNNQQPITDPQIPNTGVSTSQELNQPIIPPSFQEIPIEQSINENPTPSSISIDNPQLLNGTQPSITAPTELEQPIPNIPVDIPNISGNDLPNINTDISMPEEVNSPININQEMSVSQPKDVLPVINMIKNLAISIESLGYRLNITEDDSQTSYKITIEVEK